MVAATLFACEVYGHTVAARKSGGVWYVTLPPHPRRAEVEAKFLAANVVVLAVIKQG